MHEAKSHFQVLSSTLKSSSAQCSAPNSSSTVYISTPPTNCSSFDENDVDTSACLANKINQGGIGLLVIDQQVSFHPGGSLAIATANEDAARISSCISNHTSELDQVVLTMDSHQRHHIAHGIFWENATGDSPEPYTTIYAQNISDGVWRPRDASLHNYVLAYTQSLEASGKFSLTIWPEHCLIGSTGHNIVANVLDAALEWTKESLKPIQYVMKGSNPFTEDCSALRAEYELPYDPSTSLNTELIKTLQRSSKLVIVGEALSHCVNFTVRDLVDSWPADRLGDLIILTDCSSPVAGYEAEAERASDKVQSACLQRLHSSPAARSRFVMTFSPHVTSRRSLSGVQLYPDVSMQVKKTPPPVSSVPVVYTAA